MKNFGIFLPLFMAGLILTKAQNDVNSNSCPSFKQSADFSNPDELSKIRDEITDKLWKTNYLKLTNLGEKMKNEILSLSQSNDPYLKSIAYGFSEWAWAYLPHLDKPINFCSYGQIINATVAFMENKNCDYMFKAIEDILGELRNAILLYRENAIQKSGCNFDSSEQIQLLGGINCYMNGFSYDFDKIWDLFGSKYPPEYKDLVNSLYKSDNYMDKTLALLATSLLSDVMIGIDDKFPQDDKFQLFYSSVTGTIPDDCCGKFANEIDSLILNMAPEALSLIDIIKKSTGCPFSQ